MSTFKKCHYCGSSFEDKGGFNESPRVKESAFGQAYAVCSVKCEREFNEYKESKKINSENPKVLTENSSDEAYGNLIFYVLCFGFLGGGIFLFTVPNGWGGGLVCVGLALLGLIGNVKW